jgi:surface protein
VSNVQNFSFMFGEINGNVVFNNGGSPSISGWTTSACTDMSSMFQRNYVFNQPIGSWDVSNVQNFSYMFGIGINTNLMTFDQDLSNWDVSSATNMNGMFQGCSGFNQDISSWVVSGVTDMTEILKNTGISTENYNKILTGWTGWDGTGATKTLVSGVTFGADNLTFTSGGTAEDARNYLITGLTWTITDGGGV